MSVDTPVRDTPVAARAERATSEASSRAVWPTTIFLTLLVGVPMVVIVVYSLLSRTERGYGVQQPWTFEAYVKLFFSENFLGETVFDPRYLSVMWTSVWLSAVTTIVCVVLAVPVAVWIATRPERRRPLLIFIITIPFWTNTLVRTYAFVLILNDNGIVSNGLQATGIKDGPLGLLYTNYATMIGLIYTFLPFMILPIYASAEKFDFRLAEAAYDLGARRWTVVRRILLPVITPGIIAGTALVFIPALGSFLQPDLLGGGKNLMIGSLIQLQFLTSRNWPLGAALSVLLLVLTVVSLLLVAAWSRRSGRSAQLL